MYHQYPTRSTRFQFSAPDKNNQETNQTSNEGQGTDQTSEVAEPEGEGTQDSPYQLTKEIIEAMIKNNKKLERGKFYHFVNAEDFHNNKSKIIDGINGPKQVYKFIQNESQVDLLIFSLEQMEDNENKKIYDSIKPDIKEIIEKCKEIVEKNKKLTKNTSLEITVDKKYNYANILKSGTFLVKINTQNVDNNISFIHSYRIWNGAQKKQQITCILSDIKKDDTKIRIKISEATDI